MVFAQLIFCFTFKCKIVPLEKKRAKYISLGFEVLLKINPSSLCKISYGSFQGRLSTYYFSIIFFHWYLCCKCSYQNRQASLAIIITQIPCLQLLMFNNQFYVSYHKFLLENLN